jgi:uncharacterized protein
VTTALPFVSALVGLYLAALLTLVAFQRWLIYLPKPIARSPTDVGLGQARVLQLHTPDGEVLPAWYVPPARARPLILYFHGNAARLADKAERFRNLTATGHGLLAVEYRGFAGATGSPSEQGLLIDGDTAYAQALSLGAKPSRLVVLGESLGSGVAVSVAARREVGAIVLDSPYDSVVAVAARRYWMFPVRTLMRDTFRSDERIGKVAAPLLMVHGTKDRTVPFASGARLFALANEPKRFIRLDGVGHLGLDLVIPQVLEWIDATLQ